MAADFHPSGTRNLAPSDRLTVGGHGARARAGECKAPPDQQSGAPDREETARR